MQANAIRLDCKEIRNVMDLSAVMTKLNGLDGLINNPARLMIVYLLARQPSLEYPRLMELTGLSSGNITTHLQKLSRAGYVRQKKSFAGNKPRTTLLLTDKGRDAYAGWGRLIVDSLPDEVRDSLRRQVVHNIKPRQINYSLIWDQEIQPRHGVAGAEWGTRLLPPLPGSFI